MRYVTKKTTKPPKSKPKSKGKMAYTKKLENLEFKPVMDTKPAKTLKRPDTPLASTVFNTKVDPDAPGTPGKPGYEPAVKRSDLDAKGKAIWDKNKNKKNK